MPSTAIRDLDYDPDAQTLAVTFVTSGRRYRYFDVPLDAFEALTSAFSKGSWFNAHIRDRFDYEIMFDPKAPAPSQVPFLRP